MSKKAETVVGFERRHHTMISVARFFAGLGWFVSLVGLITCILSWRSVSVAIGALISDGIGADVSAVVAGGTPFIAGVMILLSGLIVVSFGQVLRVVSSIEANTQAAFLLLNRRLPNPHPDVDSYAGLNDHGMGSFPR